MISALRFAHRRSDDRGQSLVEFALILPFLLILLMGIFEVGRAWQRYQVITDIAREGARVAARGTSNYGISADSIDSLIDFALTDAGLDPAEATVTFPNGRLGDAGVGTGSAMVVRIDYPHDIPFLNSFLGIFRGNDPNTPPGPTLVLKTQVGFRNE